MKGKLTLRTIDEYEPYDCNLFMDKEPFDYELEIFTDLTKPYSKLMPSIKDLDDSINTFMSMNDEPEIIEFYKNCQKHKQELFDNIEYIEIDYDIKSIIKYLKANPCLKNKKIIINDVPEFSLDIINEININLTDTSNLYFNVEGNYNPISFKEYSEFILTLNNIIDDVKKYNFSIFETIMYVYDIVRDKVYQEVSENENKHISRNVTTSLMGDKIVCLGYANIFKYILDKLGIDCQVVFLFENDKEGGHARNEIYIKDPKYNIDGVYYFDPTWDSKKNNDNSYLASYRCFALTKDEMDKEDIKRKYDFYNDLIPAYSPDLLDKFNEDLYNNAVPEDLIKTIKHMSMLIDNVPLISKHIFSPDFPNFLKPNINDVKSKIKNLITYFEKPLTADIYIQALYNVRRIEYYRNPNKYPFTFKDFYRILVNSKWQFSHEDINNLLYTLATDDKRLIMDLDDLDNYFKENNLNRSMQYLRLTRTLKTIYEKKENNN